MNEYENNFEEERLNLSSVVKFIKSELEFEETLIDDRLKNLISSSKAMWEDTSHASNDFDKIPEMQAYLTDVNSRNDNYQGSLKKIQKYRSMINSPYFGRFDFIEEGYNDTEALYIGLYNLFDKNSNSILVYDWRSPVAGMFYQYEIGKASYPSPQGEIQGQLSLKRQYKIENSNLIYFFDSSLRISDEILQEVLSQNTSQKMKNIVETIQKEQDLIIRDNKNQLLLVQGVAGSGKTSVALHRIAFLLYTGMNTKLNSNNIIIISPNSLFSDYISGVLPELGEENVNQLTFDVLSQNYLYNTLTLESKNTYLEKIITENWLSPINHQNTEFKGSPDFVKLLNRYIKYYEHHFIPFQDVYYEGKIIETSQLLKAFFLNNKIDMPATKRLERIENMLFQKIAPLRKERLYKIEKIVQKNIEHQLEIKPFSRLLSIKETKTLMDNIYSFTKLDYLKVYLRLFEDKDVFFKLAKGLELPEGIDEIITNTKAALLRSYIPYEDLAPLLFIKFKLEGSKEFQYIKHVIIDEAQDYNAIQYEVFKQLFKNASYTVLGDINQTIDKKSSSHIYDIIEKILGNQSTLRLTLNKSYRSSVEICNFANKILNNTKKLIPFERHESMPEINPEESIEGMLISITADIINFHKLGYKSIAIICKIEKEAKALKDALMLHTSENVIDLMKTVSVIPVFMAKGLEYDAVIVYNTSEINYKTELDRQLLYIACTRALHKLKLYYIKEKSVFLSF